jgi:PAS domain S-box-containing protein
VTSAAQILQRALLGEAVDGADGIAVFVWDDDRHYVAVSDGACELVGLAREELIGMPVGNMSPERAAGDIARTTSANVTHGTSSFDRRTGERVDIAWVTVHTRVAGLPYMVSVVWPAR